MDELKWIKGSEYFPTVDDVGCNLIVEVNDVLKRSHHHIQLLQTSILELGNLFELASSIDPQMEFDYHLYDKFGLANFCVTLSSIKSKNKSSLINQSNITSTLLITSEFIKFDTSSLHLSDNSIPPLILIPITEDIRIEYTHSNSNCLILFSHNKTIKFFTNTMYNSNIIVYIIRQTQQKDMKIIHCNIERITSNNINESYFYTVLQIIEDEYSSNLSIIRNEIVKKDELITELKNEIVKHLNKNEKQTKRIKEYDNINKINELKSIINSLTAELIKKDKIIEKLTFSSNKYSYNVFL